MATPLDRCDIADALTRAGLDGSLRAALAVALPADEVPQLAVAVSSTTLCWRGASVPRTGDPAGDAAALAAAGWAGGDSRVDASDPMSWVRVRRSGAAKVCFGADVLAGRGVVTADLSVPDASIREVLGGLDSADEVLGVFRGPDGGVVWVADSDRGVHLSDLDGMAPPRPGTIADLAAVAAEVADELDASVVDTVVTYERTDGYEADVMVRVAGVDGVVPVVVGADGVSMGALRSECSVTSRAPTLPGGFSFVGVDVWEGVAVGECERSGICVKFSDIKVA